MGHPDQVGSKAFRTDVVKALINHSRCVIRLWSVGAATLLAAGLRRAVRFLRGLGFILISAMIYALLAQAEFNVLSTTLFHLSIKLTSALYAGLIATAVVFVRRDRFLMSPAPAP